jgi:hypothetical protein
MKQSRRFRFVLGLVTDFSIFSRFWEIDSDDGKVQCFLLRRGSVDARAQRGMEIKTEHKKFAIDLRG